MAQLMSTTRFLVPVLVKILLTWLSTVRLLMESTWAISWLVSPRAKCSMISISRSERPTPTSRGSATGFP